MRLVKQSDYRAHTLLLFEERVADDGREPRRHWTVIAPGGINILGGPHASEADARAFVDRRIDQTPQSADSG